MNWSDEAIEAALGMFFATKTTNGQKRYRETMKIALEAAYAAQVRFNKSSDHRDVAGQRSENYRRNPEDLAKRCK